MKKGILLIAIIMGFGLLQVNAQEPERKSDYHNHEIRTLTGNKNISNGFYAGLSFGYSPIANKDAFTSGVRLAWVINHSFALGIAGISFISDLDHYNDISDDDFFLTGGYGGLYMEPIFFAKSPIHFSIPITIGMGGIYGWDEVYYTDPWEYDHYDYHEDWDAFFVVEPGIELDINVVRFMRLSFGATYRLTDDIQMNSVENIAVEKDALRNMSGYFSLKFGKF